jgi:outer membrane beta-barrel protein
VTAPLVEPPETGDLYWASKRSLEVIQKKDFRKEGRHEFTPFFGVIPNDDFLFYIPTGLRYSYHMSEDLAAELAGAWTWNVETSLKDKLSEKRYQMHVYLPQWIEWYAGLNGIWSPIHGKISFFEGTIVPFDVGLAFGVDLIWTHVRTVSEDAGRADVGGDAGLCVRLYVTDWAAVRLDYRQFFYPALPADQDGKGGVAYPGEFTLGFSVFTSAAE